MEAVVAVASSSVLSVSVGALIARRRDNFKVLTDVLVDRVTKLETRVDTVETKLDAEQIAHEKTRMTLAARELALAAARAFIRSVQRWAAGDRLDPPPEPPAEVMAE